MEDWKVGKYRELRSEEALTPRTGSGDVGKVIL
jgi:hypothetical protein